MSLLNVWLSQDKALIGVDTKGMSGDGKQSVEVSKIFPLVHANVILAGRGYMPFLGIVSSALHSIGGNFDAIVERLPEVLPAAFRAFATEMTKGGYDPKSDGIDLHRQDVMLVGWSPKRGRMVGMVYRQRAADEGFVAKEFSPWTVNPWEPVQGGPYEPSSYEAHERLAREQARFTQKTVGKRFIGGRLLIAELTRDSLSVTSRCDLDQPVLPDAASEQSDVQKADCLVAA
jgi:hypothetical protein